MAGVANGRIAKIKNLVRSKFYRLSTHAEAEREADMLTRKEIEEALVSDELEIIEDYPDDKRGASFLVLGFTKNNEPVHFVLTLAFTGMLFVITMYRPDAEQWVDFKVRKR